MAGTKGRSGARGRFKDFEPGEAAPELNPDRFDSLLTYLTWIAREQAAGNIDRADARELRDTVKAISLVRQAKFRETEIDELRELVRRAEEAAQRGRENAMASRHGRAGKATKCAPQDANSQSESGESPTKNTGTSH